MTKFTAATSAIAALVVAGAVPAAPQGKKL